MHPLPPSTNSAELWCFGSPCNMLIGLYYVLLLVCSPDPSLFVSSFSVPDLSYKSKLCSNTFQTLEIFQRQIEQHRQTLSQREQLCEKVCCLYSSGEIANRLIVLLKNLFLFCSIYLCSIHRNQVVVWNVWIYMPCTFLWRAILYFHLTCHHRPKQFYAVWVLSVESSYVQGKTHQW